jgi:tetratricopeptide (TPR) repeat protein
MSRTATTESSSRSAAHAAGELHPRPSAVARLFRRSAADTTAMNTILLLLTLFQSVPDVYKAANSDFDAQRWADAAAKYEQVLKEDASHIPSRFNLAVCYSKLGKLDEAISAYRTLIEQNGAIYEARVNLAILLEQTDKRAEAGEQFEKALAIRPDDTQAQLNLATFYLRGNESDKAYPYLVAAVDKGGASADIYAALSEVEHTRKNEPKSREYLEKAIQLAPENTKFLHQLAVSYFEEMNYAKAAPVLERLTKAQPSNPDYLYLLGKSYEQLKMYPQALATLQKVIQVKPDYFEAYGTIAAIFYAQEDWARAAQALSRVIELRPREGLAHFVLATCLDKLGNEKEALVHYNKFLELDDGSNDVRSFQARERAKTLDRRLKR